MLAGGVTGLPPSSQTEGISDRSRKYALTGLTAIDSANETTSERNKKDWVKFCFSLDSFLLEMCFQMSLINLEIIWRKKFNSQNCRGSSVRCSLGNCLFMKVLMPFETIWIKKFTIHKKGAPSVRRSLASYLRLNNEATWYQIMEMLIVGTRTN